MGKKRKKRTDGSVPIPKPREDDRPPHHPSHNAIRETFESLAIAFILAFFIRTFVAEPFVIPTGSMSPSLQGVHKDLNCPQCGHRYRVNASTQAQMRGQARPDECVGGMCPMCRYTMAYDKKLANQFPRAPEKSANERSYSGDRIVVNKFLYSFTEPERWDVVVFKYPGNATDNYIKRLVGLPEETLRIYGGDLFVKESDDDDFRIARKPPRTAYAMRQEVHDTDRDPAVLDEAGWPLRWLSDDGWETDTTTSGKMLRQTYTSAGEGESWLSYRHTPPTNPVWPMLEAGGELPPATPQLVSDFNPFNTRIVLGWVRHVWRRTDNPFVVFPTAQGVHWVGDLFVEANVNVQSKSGELLLELVEAGNHFRCTVDVASGAARLSILPDGTDEAVTEFAPVAETAIRGTGKHRVMFANVDDALHLWVDDRLVKFDGATTYDWDKLFGERKGSVPVTTDDDPGDLAPARIGSNQAKLAVDRLQVHRDIHYIAAKDSIRVNEFDGIVADYLTPPPSDLLSNPRQWGLIGRRKTVEFPLAEDQFFVMGDNCPQSSDARLWNNISGENGEVSKPGGNYLERHLLIGRAISVVWPHPWHYVIPSFTDMRRIK